MSLKVRISRIAIPLAIAVGGLVQGPSAHANVYATNIKLNGGLTNVTADAGTGLTISYILNEPATRGVTVSIVSGNTAVRSINIAAGDPGTLMGVNTVSWDGMDNGGNALAGGTYKVSITAAATGFSSWTQTSTDTNAGYYVYSPRGIAVNTNPNSIYYGRVFVGNSANNGSNPGDVDGILKVNADGSLADEGQSSAGYSWNDDSYHDSPHYLRYGQDDRIYALDWTSTGVIVACDMAMTTNEIVFGPDNWVNNPLPQGGVFGWGMFDITDAGTSKGRIWVGNDDIGGVGIWSWRMVNGVADTNDTRGTQVVAIGGTLSDVPSGGFMTDESSNIFVSQGDELGDVPRAILFTNWDGVNAFTTNNVAWAAGTNDDTFNSIYDTALDSRSNPTYAAYSMGGDMGGIRVLYAASGMVVTNADGTQTLTNLDAPNTYFGVSWDAAGNLYGASDTLHSWRVFSPPGTNQATTVSVESIVVPGSQVQVPQFTSIVVNGTTVVLQFTDPADAPVTAYTLLGSSTPNGSFSPAGPATITHVGTGVYEVRVSASGSAQFYRLQRQN